jgi:hypothetical protein
VVPATVVAVHDFELRLDELLNRDVRSGEVSENLLTGSEVVAVPPSEGLRMSAQDRAWLIEPWLGGFFPALSPVRTRGLLDGGVHRHGLA